MHMSGAGKHWYFVLLALCGWWFLLFSRVFLPSCKTYLVLRALQRSGPAAQLRAGTPPAAGLPRWREGWMLLASHLGCQGGDGRFFTTRSGLKPSTCFTQATTKQLLLGTASRLLTAAAGFGPSCLEWRLYPAPEPNPKGGWFSRVRVL